MSSCYDYHMVAQQAFWHAFLPACNENNKKTTSFLSFLELLRKKEYFAAEKSIVLRKKVFAARKSVIAARKSIIAALKSMVPSN